MRPHNVYRTIVSAVREGRLKEPFSSADIIVACKGIKKSTAHTFPSKHGRGNPSKTSELFDQISRGKFKLIRPFKYGF